ncbi:MAG: hypothetical protein LBP35_05625 [Candidatus Ancillula trichonymphae]|nr:hypothetical protein [Candidatus Ancillula trichonymphae]
MPKLPRRRAAKYIEDNFQCPQLPELLVYSKNYSIVQYIKMWYKIMRTKQVHKTSQKHPHAAAALIY